MSAPYDAERPPQAPDAPRVHGHCAPRFAAVREAFEENFRARGELGGRQGEGAGAASARAPLGSVRTARAALSAGPVRLGVDDRAARGHGAVVGAGHPVRVSRGDVRLPGRRGGAARLRGAYGPNPRAFGHDGFGGSCGLADPEAGVSLGYVMNLMGPRIADDPRKTALIDALYGAL